MRNRARLSLDAITQEVAGVDYILGNEFSAADIMLGYTIMLCEKYLKEQLRQWQEWYNFSWCRYCEGEITNDF